jgi:hypothetical protein
MPYRLGERPYAPAVMVIMVVWADEAGGERFHVYGPVRTSDGMVGVLDLGPLMYAEPGHSGPYQMTPSVWRVLVTRFFSKSPTRGTSCSSYPPSFPTANNRLTPLPGLGCCVSTLLHDAE